MSNTKLEPLLTDDEIERYSMMYTIPSRYETARALKHAKGIYEAARAKDAELIETLVDALAAMADYGHAYPCVMDALSDAAGAGFKPSDR